MLESPTNPTQDHIHSDQANTFGTADGVVTETQKPQSLPTLERACLLPSGSSRIIWRFAPVEPSRSGNSD